MKLHKSYTSSVFSCAWNIALKGSSVDWSGPCLSSPKKHHIASSGILFH